MTPSDTAHPEDRATFQERVQPWMMACFGEEISADELERGDRLLEEVYELLQSGRYPVERVVPLRDYVWGRAVGEPHQEAGGVMVTLAAYCLARGLDMHRAGEDELARIWTKVEQIRAKQAAKPTGSALPIAIATPPSRPQGEEGLRVCLTPETNYEWGLDSPYTLRVTLRFPFDIQHWGKGTSAVTEGPKLQRYDQQAEERDRITDIIHDQMEVVGADAYRVMREIDHLLGTDNVERGIAATKRRRERQPPSLLTRDRPQEKGRRRERLSAISNQGKPSS